MFNLEAYRRGFLPSNEVQLEGPAADARVMELSVDDLPAVCPHRSMLLWAWHPRVFLDVVNHDEAMCPYCCTRYRLRADARVHDHEFGARCLHQHRKQDRGDVEPRGGHTTHSHAAPVHLPAKVPVPA